LSVENGLVTIEDLDSSNGTFVDGVRIKRPCELRYGQKIGIGTCTITLRPAAAEKKPAPIVERAAAPQQPRREPAAKPPQREAPARDVPVLRSVEEEAEFSVSGGGEGAATQKRAIKKQIHAEL